MRTDAVRLGRLSGEWTGEMRHYRSSMHTDRCITDADVLVDIGDLSLANIDMAAQELADDLSMSAWGLTQAKIDEALDLVRLVALRKAPGGLAPSATRIALEERWKNLERVTCLGDQRLTKLAQARDDLIADARRLVA